MRAHPSNGIAFVVAYSAEKRFHAGMSVEMLLNRVRRVAYYEAARTFPARGI